ncbi:hypothetical protein [Streptomyces hokutonensis]|uniref:hypothetical protein n=1 Tax=Streptomyces hokutonensis TaxID=1306990 RepID=UPI0036917050
MARCTGTRSPCVEGSRLLTGTGTHIDDVVRPGRPHACLVRRAVAWARAAGTDGSEALQLDGVQVVLVVLVFEPGVREQWYALNGRYAPDTRRRPLAGGAARSVGDQVATVVLDGCGRRTSDGRLGAPLRRCPARGECDRPPAGSRPRADAGARDRCRMARALLAPAVTALVVPSLFALLLCADR